jgi:hypothetical protein
MRHGTPVVARSHSPGPPWALRVGLLPLRRSNLTNNRRRPSAWRLAQRFDLDPWSSTL